MEFEGDSKAMVDAVSSSLLALTRTANSLAAQDFDFHRSLDPSVGTKLDKQNARLLDLSQRLLASASTGSKAVRPRLKDTDAIDDNWRSIVDILDSLLEKADTSLDEYSGAVKRASPGRDQSRQSSPRPARQSAGWKSNEVPKPQLDFDHRPTNTETPPFIPLLQTKPHATKSLEQSLQTVDGDDGLSRTAHPYEAEIEEYEYPSFVYTRAEPIPYQPYESTTATLVDTEEAVDEMLRELKQAKEIAIDLEHHDHRSYVGLVSLMQISTRGRDWIVDTLKPWRRKLNVLNEVFADPNILKVLHGAHMDSIWLQRDLGLYLVGLFDTHHACRVLSYPGGSLAFLLKKFVNFDAQKQYQTADWRVRPLPQELFDYARSDTHFLLYIYDNMRNELIDRSSFELPNQEGDKLHEVLMRSKEVALQVYNHPVYDAKRGLGASGWYRLLSKTPATYSKEQFSVFRRLHQWRDQVAREQDDSTHFVLSNHHLFNLAREMPTEKAALFALVSPMPQSARLRADEVLEAIASAKAAGQDDMQEMREVLRDIDVFLYGDLAATDLPAAKKAAFAQPRGPAASNVTAAVLKPVQVPEATSSSLRTAKSSFWGSVGSTHGQDPTESALSPSLVVPLAPDNVATLVEQETPAPAERQQQEPPTPTPQNTSDRDNEDIFTLRNLSHKRKADELRNNSADALATQNDEVSLGEEDLRSRREQKAQRKADKKAAKRAKKSDAAEPEEAFDYANAPSVFNASRAARDNAKEKKPKKEKKAPFSLAKGLSNVAKGLGRKHKESGGRSKTFKD